MAVTTKKREDMAKTADFEMRIRHETPRISHDLWMCVVFCCVRAATSRKDVLLSEFCRITFSINIKFRKCISKSNYSDLEIPKLSLSTVNHLKECNKLIEEHICNRSGRTPPWKHAPSLTQRWGHSVQEPPASKPIVPDHLPREPWLSVIEKWGESTMGRIGVKDVFFWTLNGSMLSWEKYCFECV
jgi:hypothetical protein